MPACCSAIEHHFSDELAAADLGRYRRGRLDGPTRRLLRAVRQHAPDPASVLDVGGGVGMILQELLPGSNATATYVDGSSAHLRAAREEAERRGYAGRARFLHGDFLDLADDVEPAEVVVMHRAVCCYPDAEGLLSAAAGRAQRVLAISYPRDAWPVRAEIRFSNWVRARRRDPLRAFVHPEALVHSVLDGAGLRRRARSATPYWRIDLYSRPSAAQPDFVCRTPL